jgi:putative addiction module component (TIGR02574 family)
MTLPAAERARLADRLWDSIAGQPRAEIVSTPELERLLDEGLENLDEARTTDELRRRP